MPEVATRQADHLIQLQWVMLTSLLRTLASEHRRRRKTLVVCAACHEHIHAGQPAAN
jgi:hypothetical protein